MLYSSYFLSEQFRFLGFGLWTFEKHQYADLGFYGSIEYGQFLDRRLGFSLLIGGHVIHARAKEVHWLLTFPQGFEMSFQDAGIRGYVFKWGAFIYPPIPQNSYYNCWIRWGKKYFLEINYLAWQLKPQHQSFVMSASSLGISLGLPLSSIL